MATETWTWVASSGASQSLTNGSNVWLEGVDGLGFAPVDLYQTRSPYQTGASFLAARLQPRTIGLRVDLVGRSYDDLGTLERQFTAVFTPELGMGTLQVVRADGAQRYLDAVYAGGLEFSSSDKTTYLRRTVINLFCPDPRWYDPTPTLTSILPTIASGGLIFPITFPLTISGSTPELGVPFSVTPAGDASTEPVVTVAGPMTNPTIVNVNQGRELRFLLTLGDNDLLSVDMRPGQKTATLATGGTTYAALRYLTAGSRFWTIAGSAQATTLLCTADSGGLSGAMYLQWFSRFWTR